MKAGTFILSFLFVTLTIQPAFITWNKIACPKEIASAKVLPGSAGCKKSAEKKCSSKKDTPQIPQQQQSEDPCNTCNPFVACNGCPYMPGEPHELVQPIPDNTENTNGLHDTSLPSFEEATWHPPELFMRL